MQSDAEIGPPTTFDPNQPSVARMYDLLLGGHEHFESDREGVDRLLQVAPNSRTVALINRAFLMRVVEVLVRDYGVRQFIDFGSGLPTQRNVHQVAQGIDRTCRVVYVDNDPMVLHTGRALLAENDNTAIVWADMRDTATIFSSSAVERLVKSDVPTAALFVSVLHCIPETNPVPPAEVVRRVRRFLPANQPAYMAISQLVSPNQEVRERITTLMAELTSNRWGEVRTASEVISYFDDMEILEPGVVEVSQWRPAKRGIRSPEIEWEEFGGIARAH
ncbi:SAM-dependent methyltransferase [Kitasatospora sp. NPDC089509]|uniref:SAM-dependent methyltransferase n=1 Tax=Kitasatospora sp. NPDC089509 TaxID=3364079 RepID=UPI0038147154